MAKDLGIGITITLRDNLSTGAKKAGEAVEGLKKSSDKSVSSLNKMQAAVNAMASSQLLSGAKTAFDAMVNSSRDFEREMAQVSTQVDTSTTSMDDLRKAVETMSVKYGTDAVQEAQGLYEALSAGIGDAEASITALDTANRMAIGGNATVGESIDGLTTIINAWGMKVEDSERIADSLFKTVQLGKLNMRDLARNVADVAPIAASLGIDLEQVGASIATMTKQGTRAPIAFTQMKAALSGMLRPTDELNALWRKNGFRSAEAAIRAKGYQGALQMILTATKGNKGELQKYLGGMEAANAVLQISGDKAELFAQSLNEVKNSSGAAQLAFEKASSTNDFRMKQAEQSWEKMKRTVGTQMLIALEPAIKKFTELTKVAGEWLDKNPAWAKAIGLTVAGLVALAFVLGVVAVAMFILEVISSPVILIILAIAAAIAVVIAILWYFKPTLLKAWEWVKMAVGKIGDAFAAFGKWVAEIFSSAYDAVANWAKGVGEWFMGIWNWLKNLALKFIEFVEMIPFAGDLVKDLHKTIADSPDLTINVAKKDGAGGQTQAVRGPTPWQAVQQAQTSLLSVKNPSAQGTAPIQIENKVNLPKQTITPASVQIDKREIARINFDIQQQEGVRQ